MVHEIVGRINGHYGTLTHVPIHHLDRQLTFHELCALYAITDVALVTSLRDGMNLVSYEYVACQSDNAGMGHTTVLAVYDSSWLMSLAFGPVSAVSMWHARATMQVCFTF